MKKTLLVCLALCCATQAHAGWFDSYSDEVPPSIKVERMAGGTDQWNATQFFTTSTISREGKPVINREDGHYYDNVKVSSGRVRPQGATVCQKDNLMFYIVGRELFQVNLDTKSAPESIWKFDLRPNDPSKGKSMVGSSPLSITNDCSKMVLDFAYYSGEGAKTDDKLHGNYEVRYYTTPTDVFLGELKDGKWAFKKILASDQWLSHPLIEPVNGDKLIIYNDGPTSIVREACNVMDIDGSNLRKVTDVPNHIGTQLCQWLGDGRHVITKTKNSIAKTTGYMLIDGYTRKIEGQIDLPFHYTKVTHEITPKLLKNGNVGAIGDAYDNGIYYIEFDFKKEKLLRWSKVASYGKRMPSNNHLLPSDEGWYPHVNISQDGKFVAFTSQNGIGEKGSDVYVISGLPD